MADLTATSSDDSIYQIESADDVQGGAGAIANRQAQSLLNKITFNKDLYNGANAPTVLVQVSDMTLSSGGCNKMYVMLLGEGDISSITLPVLSTCKTGDTLIFSGSANGGAMTVVPQGSDKIVDRYLNSTSLYIGPRESVCMRKGPAGWVIVWHEGLEVPAGTIVLIPHGIGIDTVGYLKCDNSYVDRVAYARLFNIVQDHYIAYSTPHITQFGLPSYPSISANGAGGPAADYWIKY